jgi:hypothetical protein
VSQRGFLMGWQGYEAPQPPVTTGRAAIEIGARTV